LAFISDTILPSNSVSSAWGVAWGVAWGDRIMKKNYLISVKTDKEMMDLLEEATNGTGFERCILIRLILRKGLKKLKSDSIIAGGWDKLEFI
jgi:hypothetical protein